MSLELDVGALSWRRFMTWVRYNTGTKGHSAAWSDASKILSVSSTCALAATAISVAAGVSNLSYALTPCAVSFLLALAFRPALQIMERRPPRLFGRRVCVRRCSPRNHQNDHAHRGGSHSLHRSPVAFACLESIRLFRLPRALNILFLTVTLAAATRIGCSWLWSELVAFVERDQGRIDRGFTNALLALRPWFRKPPAVHIVADDIPSNEYTPLALFLFVRIRWLTGGTCDATELVAAAHMDVSPGACDVTPTGERCSNFGCKEGYTGGLITCQPFGRFSVSDCTKGVAIPVGSGAVGAYDGGSGLEAFFLGAVVQAASIGGLVFLLTVHLLFLWPEDTGVPRADCGSRRLVVASLESYLGERAAEALLLWWLTAALLGATGTVLPLTLSLVTALLHFVPLLGGWISISFGLLPFIALDTDLSLSARVGAVVAAISLQILVPLAIRLWATRGAQRALQADDRLRPLSTLVAVLVAVQMLGSMGAFLGVPALLVFRQWTRMRAFALHPLSARLLACL